jgi:hypothetical protein
VVQAPRLQTCVPLHDVVQLPQNDGSVCVFTQAPLQSVLPAAHWQDPFWHAVPPVQVAPQLPQLFESVCKFTQLPEHCVAPAAQPVPPSPVLTHPPPEQAALAPHA